MKTRGFEPAIQGFDTYYSFVTQVPDQDPDSSPETELVIEDLGIGCVMGTLLCLERTQRVVFILAVGFGVTDTMGAEILDMSPAAFRQTLSRARARLHQYMSGNCGLLNPKAPCRCRKKAKGFLDSGAYSADRLSFRQARRPRLRDMVGETIQRFDAEIYGDYVRLFREHPFYNAPDAVAWLRGLVERRSFQEIFHLDDREKEVS
jgi:hypothetical protein